MAIPRGAALIGTVALSMLAACAPAPPATGINDPNETANRGVHEMNVAIDRAFLKPSSQAFVIIPEPVQKGLSNVASNFDAPGDVVNGVLQGDVEHAVENTFRFLINSTLGIGGIFDPATAIGLPGRETDFGETLHVWGAGEGAYMELPLLGPSTERDTAGRVVDIALNPMRFILPKPERYVGTVAGIASRIGERDSYSEIIDSVLYDSADSYAQARLLYLQNRRFELGQEQDADVFDPYEDPYGQ